MGVPDRRRPACDSTSRRSRRGSARSAGLQRPISSHRRCSRHRIKRVRPSAAMVTAFRPLRRHGGHRHRGEASHRQADCEGRDHLAEGQGQVAARAGLRPGPASRGAAGPERRRQPRHQRLGQRPQPAGTQSTTTVDRGPGEFATGAGPFGSAGTTQHVNTSHPQDSDTWRAHMNNTAAAAATFRPYVICTDVNSVSEAPQLGPRASAARVRDRPPLATRGAARGLEAPEPEPFRETSGGPTRSCRRGRRRPPGAAPSTPGRPRRRPTPRRRLPRRREPADRAP